MSDHKILLIRNAIEEARYHEHQSNELLHFLQALAPRLHRAIKLPPAEPGRALLTFVIRYIEQVPDFLQALEELMVQANIYQHGKVFITIAEEFFLQPPKVAQSHSGLHALLDEAYLAHRLLEEVNDRLLMSCGVPLTPMDMTLSNIVVHDLLGEEYANQLDLAVHFSIDALFDSNNLIGCSQLANFITQHTRSNWEEKLKNWPCMALESSIAFSLSDDSESVNPTRAKLPLH